MTKLGDTVSTQVDVRIVSATKRDLQRDVAAGKFREDLFYRLNVFSIKIPPLRDRKKYIPLLAKYFNNPFAEKMSKNIEGMSKEFLE